MQAESNIESSQEELFALFPFCIKQPPVLKTTWNHFWVAAKETFLLYVGNCRPQIGLCTSLIDLRISELEVNFALKPLHVLYYFRFNDMTFQ